jgi:hypothetical protein
MMNLSLKQQEKNKREGVNKGKKAPDPINKILKKTIGFFNKNKVFSLKITGI